MGSLPIPRSYFSSFLKKKIVFFAFFKFIYLFNVYRCFVCKYAYTPEEGVGSHGTVVVGG